MYDSWFASFTLAARHAEQYFALVYMSSVSPHRWHFFSTYFPRRAE